MNSLAKNALLLTIVTLSFTYQSHAKKTSLEQRLLSVVGKNAVRCGVFHFNDRKSGYLSGAVAAKAIRCMTIAYQHSQGFYLSDEGSGIDSYVARGILGTPNRSGIYRFDYDSSPSGGGFSGHDAFGMASCHKNAVPGKIDPEADCGITLKAPPPEPVKIKIKSKPTRCEFTQLKLPDDFAVLAVSGGRSHETGFQIDQSGYQALQIEVLANRPDKPLVLILGQYEPTIWNIHWTQGTHIIAVVAGGLHRQAVAGLPRGIPMLNSTIENEGGCKDFNLWEPEAFNPLSRRLFGRPVEKVYLAENGNVLVGGPLSPDIKVLSSSATPPKSFFDKNAPLAGEAGLEDGIKKGLLRKATEEDARAWFAQVAERAPSDVPPIAGQETTPKVPGIYEGTYVVLKPFVFPAALFGGHSATFFIPRGVPMPNGDPGHSTIYDFNTFAARQESSSPQKR
ncbi:hypothetical protein [Methylovulum psychrotolerans]|uniref:Uncharacterized protein n=1 Tax=Methylovulum psychrotolerans TaxID=1704499 RepID=A0A2S5CQL5_9GAMM|nr:hypothetical protein [Methylovulum psychrotolerans]POZ53121.1 hypothetical protein AADEFJLK_00135 [Methylovulum psychrotolerans]